MNIVCDEERNCKMEFDSQKKQLPRDLMPFDLSRESSPERFVETFQETRAEPKQINTETVRKYRSRNINTKASRRARKSVPIRRKLTKVSKIKRKVNKQKPIKRKAQIKKKPKAKKSRR